MSSIKEIMVSGREAIWAIIMTLIILGGIIFGWVNSDGGIHYLYRIWYVCRILHLP